MLESRVLVKMGVWSGVERDSGNVRFGSLADIGVRISHVRFTPNNGRSAGASK
jgi:hypothetical protein